jgi:hypothetical protein
MSYDTSSAYVPVVYRDFRLVVLSLLTVLPVQIVVQLVEQNIGKCSSTVDIG